MMNGFQVLLLSLVLIPVGLGTSAAGGPFGPPQPASKGSGGLYTAIGYGHQEDRYGNDGEYLLRQNQVYSEAGYRGMDRWKVYARIGAADLNVRGAFNPATPEVITSKSDFDEKRRFFGTLGASAFYPFNAVFGIGAFFQGNRYFSDFRDQVTGSRDGIPFDVELHVKSLYDLNLGFDLQAKTPCGVILYGGPCLTYSEAVLTPSADVPGLRFVAGDNTIRNRTLVGGIAGIEANLAKGFRLNVEGRYTERLSAGVAVLYFY